MNNTALQEQFNKYKEDLAQRLKQSGADKAIESISTVIHELQSIGIDVSIDLHYAVSGTVDDEFNSLIRKVGYEDYSSTSSVVGEMSIGTKNYAVALCTSDKWNKAVLMLYTFAKDEKETKSNKYEKFNFQNSGAAEILQTHILQVAARQMIVSDYDVAKVFGRRDAPANTPKIPLAKKKIP